MFQDLKAWMPEFHKTGAKLFVQLTAGFGRSFAVSEMMEKIYTNKVLRTLAKPVMNLDKITASASDSSNRWSDVVPSRAMTKEKIHEFVDAFAKSAKLLQKAGVDGVEIHAVHEGYLLDQFTLKYVNHRTDEYGGSFENRYRFAVEIVQAIKKACGDDFPVSPRYSVVSKTKGFRQGALPEEDYIEVGRDMEESKKAARYLQEAGYDMLNCDNGVSKTKGFRQGALPEEDYIEVGRDMEESKKAARYLQEAGYDMLNCDNGTYDAWYWSHPPIYMPENCNLQDVETLKEAIRIPVVCAGRLDPRTAADSIAQGKLDGAGFARQFLADPCWITKLLEDKEEEIRPCILCHNGCFTMSHYKGVANAQDLEDSLHLARCAINAEMMQWNTHYIEKTKKPKTVHIIGGGIGGMEVARVCRLRGHTPIIYEKSHVLGGTFIPASAESYKGKLRDLLTWYRHQMDILNIEVHLDTEIQFIEDFLPDPVVIATGSKPRIMKNVPGHEKIIEACDYLKGTSVGQRVAVIGGGLTGCEIAYELALQKKDPIIVEMKNDLVAQKGVCLANSSYLREWFALHKVPAYLETSLKEVRDGSIICLDTYQKEFTIPCDSVIGSVGYIPDPLVKEGKNISLVGDCKQVGNLRTVIWGAYKVAMKL